MVMIGKAFVNKILSFQKPVWYYRIPSIRKMNYFLSQYLLPKLGLSMWSWLHFNCKYYHHYTSRFQFWQVCCMIASHHSGFSLGFWNKICLRCPRFNVRSSYWTDTGKRLLKCARIILFLKVSLMFLLIKIKTNWVQFGLVAIMDPSVKF